MCNGHPLLRGIESWYMERSNLMYRNVRLAYIIMVALLLLVSLSACASARQVPESGLEDGEVRSYIADIDSILNETTGMALEATSIYKVVNQLEESEITQMFDDYDREYDNLLEKLSELQRPPECEKLYQHALNGVGYFKQEVAELGIAYTTGSDSDKAKSFYKKGQDELLLVAKERDRLMGY